MKKMLTLLLLLHSILALSSNPPTDIIKIMKSGNGQSIETAYKVNSIDEEYDVLRHLKLKPIMQKLYMKDGDFYDAIQTDSKTIYFKIIPKTKINKKLFL